MSSNNAAPLGPPSSSSSAPAGSGHSGMEPGSQRWLRAAPAGALSTQARIGLAFAALALAIFGVVGAVSARYAQRQVASDTGDGLLQLASRMAFALDSDVYERFREVKNLSTLQPLVNGQVTPAEWRALVEQLQRSFRHYAWIGLAAPDGKLLAATGGLLEGASVAKREWFQQASKGPFVGDLHEALLLAKQLPPRKDGEPLRLVDVAAPLHGSTGLLGVLGAHLDLAWAEERRGAVLATVAGDRHVELLVFERNGQPVLTAGKGVAARPQAALEALVRNGPSLDVWSDGQTYLTAATRNPPSALYPDLGWTVVARQPETTGLAAARRLQTLIWTVGLLGAGLFGLAAWWLAGWLTAPLRKVAAQALAVTPAAASTSPRGDEVVVLSQALGDLVARLRQREQQLVAANGTLEAKVSERTAALEQSNADLRSFSHSVSHDLKGPVGGIGAALRMVLKRADGSLGEANTRTLAMLVTECDRVRALTDEMLALAMLEQHTLTLAPVAMATLVRTVVDDVRSQVDAGLAPGSATTQVEMEPLPDAMGDPVLLRQVWHNLIANAFKFSSRQPAPLLRITAAVQADELVYQVQDNGAGFDASKANRLFGIFQRFHTAADFPGTGIGLSIVKRIVSRHGGRIWAVSEKGQGATFSFSVRRQPVDAPAPVMPPAAQRDSTSA